MALSWVAGTQSVFGTATTLAATTPSGILDGDGLFAFVMTQSAMTPPAGWTVVATQSATTASLTSYVSFVKKDTVVAANSSTSYTWTQASGSRPIGVTYGVVRAAVGQPAVVEVSTVAQNAVFARNLTISSLTATFEAGELFFAAASGSWQIGVNSPVPPTGFTKWTGDNLSDYRLSAGYQARSIGQSNSTTYTNVSDDAFGENALVGFTVRLRDAGAIVAMTESFTVEDLFAHPERVTDAATLGATAAPSMKTSVAAVEAGVQIVQQAASILRRGSEALAESVTMALALTFSARNDTVLVEGVQVGSVAGVQSTLRPTLQERLVITELVRVGHAAGVTDAAVITALVVAARHVTLLEQIGVLPALGALATYRRDAAEQALLQDALARALGGTAAEAALILDVAARRHVVTAVSAETVTLAGTLTPYLLIRVDTPEAVQVSSTLSAAQQLTAIIQEAVTLSGMLIGPSQLLTWAVNTRNGAAANYTNFNYTSFARRQTHYLATADDGLYRLDGDTDNGTAVIAELETGFLQFAGSRFSAFKALYLGVHGSGEMFVRLTTGDEKTYTYRVIAQSMETTKVRVGKGLRARYFAFALVTTGQDFDLDTVEFLPMVAGRRV